MRPNLEVLSELILQSLSFSSSSKKASTEGAFRQASFNKLIIVTASGSSFKPASRDKIKILRATSCPLKSSLGSGSVYPFAFAAFTTSTNLSPTLKLLNQNARTLIL